MTNENYVSFEAEKLDAIPDDRDRYTAAGAALDQARQLVGEVAAYRDTMVADMVGPNPARGDQSAVARRLGVHRNVIGRHLKHHNQEER